jgi:catechol 2,3-dioxygenase-like lactoylglutathione lyase family enzyme
MFKILQIDHIVLRVSELQPMLDFYLGTLGCTLERVREDLGLYQIRAGDALIDLVTLDGKLGRAGGKAPGREGRNLDHFCLRVEPFDPDLIMAHLHQHGMEGSQLGSRYGAQGLGLSLYVSDPEGNVVELKGSVR